MFADATDEGGDCSFLDCFVAISLRRFNRGEFFGEAVLVMVIRDTLTPPLTPPLLSDNLVTEEEEEAVELVVSLATVDTAGTATGEENEGLFSCC